MENFPVKMQNANGLVTEALHTFLPCVQHVDEDFTLWPVEVNFQTPHTTRKEQPHFFHLPLLVETILPYCTMISKSISSGVTKKGSDSEALNHSTKNSFLHADACKETACKLGCWSAPSQNTPGDHLSNLTWCHTVTLPHPTTKRHRLTTQGS